jgi:hypothetical protein
VTVQVNAAIKKINSAPVAMAGSDTTIYLPANSYMLNASSSYDPDGTISSYQWQEISGPATATASTMIGSEIDVTNLQEGVYQFELTVTDNQGATSTATVKIVVDKSPTGTNKFILYPNPAHDFITGRLDGELNGTVKLIVYDINGKVVLNTEMNKTAYELEKTWNVSGLASGMYTVLITIANRQTLVSKFIKR